MTILYTTIAYRCQRRCMILLTPTSDEKLPFYTSFGWSEVLYAAPRTGVPARYLPHTIQLGSTFGRQWRRWWQCRGRWRRLLRRLWRRVSRRLVERRELVRRKFRRPQFRRIRVSHFGWRARLERRHIEFAVRNVRSQQAQRERHQQIRILRLVCLRHPPRIGGSA